METQSTAVVSSTDMSKITLINSFTSPLLRLPAELRNRIYTYLALSTTVRAKEIEKIEGSTRTFIKYNFPLPGLLQACTQTRHEATPLICAHATFYFKFEIYSLQYPRCSHELLEHVTTIKLGSTFADYIAWYPSRRRGFTREYVPPAEWLPNLKKIHVWSWNAYKLWQEEKIRAALRAWCEDTTVEVVFESLVG